MNRILNYPIYVAAGLALCLGSMVSSAPAHADSFANGTNAGEDVVGWSDTATGQRHAVLYHYGRAYDLGTLGGANSEATAINNNTVPETPSVLERVYAHIAGVSDTFNGTHHAFLLQNGRMVDLGTLGGTNSTAYGLDIYDQVVGVSDTATGAHRAFLWKSGAMTDLGTLGGANSEARAINYDGKVVGAADTAAGQSHAFLYYKGKMTDLGTLGGADSEALALNDAGAVVGVSDTADGKQHAFLYQNGKMTDLGTLGGANSVAVGIDPDGFIAGNSDTADGKRHVFRVTNGTMADLGTFGGASSTAGGIDRYHQVIGGSENAKGEPRAVKYGLNPEGYGWYPLGSLGIQVSVARAINDKGQIVGWSDTPNSNQSRAFLYQNGAMSDLGSFGGGYSAAYDINNSGQIIGWASDSTGFTTAFLYRDGAMSAFGPSVSHGIVTAMGINDNGQIAGYWDEGTHTWAVNHAFLDTGGNFIDLGTLGGPSSEALGLNDLGDVVGYADLPLPDTGPSPSDTVVYPEFHAFLYHNGQISELPGGIYADAINNKGQIVGQNNLGHAFLYSDGVMTDLGTLGESRSEAFGINDAGQIVGRSYNVTPASVYSGRGFLYENGKMTDLGTLGGNDTIAYDINASGQIVGSSVNGEGQTHAFLYSEGKMIDLVGLKNPAVTGDVNGDGRVSISDVVLALQIVIRSVTPTSAQNSAADMNGDGKVGMGDVQMLLFRAIQ